VAPAVSGAGVKLGKGAAISFQGNHATPLFFEALQKQRFPAKLQVGREPLFPSRLP
jgi:hypothetical protein